MSDPLKKTIDEILNAVYSGTELAGVASAEEILNVVYNGTDALQISGGIPDGTAEGSLVVWDATAEAWVDAGGTVTYIESDSTGDLFTIESDNSVSIRGTGIKVKNTADAYAKIILDSTNLGQIRFESNETFKGQFSANMTTGYYIFHNAMDGPIIFASYNSSYAEGELFRLENDGSTLRANDVTAGVTESILSLYNPATGADGGGVAISLDGKDALDADVTFGTIEGSWLDESAGTKQVKIKGADRVNIIGDGTGAYGSDGTFLRVENSSSGYAGAVWKGSSALQFRFHNAADIAKGAITYDISEEDFLFQNTGTGDIIFSTNGNFGINTTSPDRKLDVLDDASPQLRLTHTDGSVYGEIQVDSNGDTIFTTTGTQYTFDAPVKVNSDVVDTTTDVETSTTTVSNTTDKTAVFTSAIGTVNVGQIIKTEAWGTVTNDSASDDLVIDVDFNGTNLEQVDVAMGAVSDAHWHAKVDVIIRSTGATGTVAYHGDILLDGTTYNFVGTATVDTTTGSVTTSVTWDTAKTGNTFLSLGAFREDKNRQ